MAVRTRRSDGRIIPLNKAALDAFKQWKCRWPNAKPDDHIFPAAKLAFKGKGAQEHGIMTPHEVDPKNPLGAWKRAWNTAKKQAGVECRIHDLRHHFISALAQTQTPDATILAISGHISRKMLEHYSGGSIGRASGDPVIESRAPRGCCGLISPFCRGSGGRTWHLCRTDWQGVGSILEVRYGEGTVSLLAQSARF